MTRASGYKRVGAAGWSLLSDLGGATAVVAASRSRTLGRARERHVLEEGLRRAGTGDASTIVITGDVGLGKTRLVDDLCESAATQGFTACRCATWQDLDAPFLTIAPNLLPLLGRGPADHATQVPSIVADVLAHVRTRPLLLVVDDVAWADELSREVLADLVRACGDASRRADPLHLLVVLTGRPHDGAPDQLGSLLGSLLELPGVDHLELEPLGVRDAVALAEAASSGSSDRATAEHLAEGAAGNPLLIITMARLLVAKPGSTPSRPVTRGDQLDSLFDVPITGAVAGLLRQQFSDLDPVTRDVLATAAVCGPIASADRLARLLAFPEVAVHQALEEAEEHGIAHRGPPPTFVHPMLRQIAYTSMPTLSRKLLHVRVAEDVGEHGPDEDNLRESELVIAAFHLRRAGAIAPPERVVETCRRAADLAFTERAWGEAARNYEAVLAASPVRGTADSDPDVVLLAARSRMHNLDLEDAMAHARQAVDAFDATADAGGRAEALAVQHRCEIMLGRMGRQLDDAPLEAIVFTEAELPAHARIRAMVDLSERRWMAGDIDGGAALADDATGAAIQIDDPVLLRAATVSRATCDWLRLDPRPARVRLLQHLDDRTVVAAPPDLCIAAGRLALTSWWLGHPGESVRFASVAEQIATTSEQPGERVIPLAVLAARAIHEANLPLAESLVDEALSIQRAALDHWASAFLYPPLAGALALHGRGREASQLLTIWSAEIDRHGGGAEARFADLCMAWVRLWRGAPTVDDIHRFRSAADLIDVLATDTTPLMLGAESFLAIHADAAELLGDADLARAVAPGLRRCTERGVVLTSATGALVARLEAAAARVRGDVEAAGPLLDLAERTAVELELVAETGRVQLERARLLAITDPQLAAPLLELALARLRALGLVGLSERPTTT